MPQQIFTLTAKYLPLPHQENNAFWLDIFKKLCAQNKMPWRTLNNSKVISDTEVAYKYKIQELTLAVDMYNSSLSWIYRVLIFYQRTLDNSNSLVMAATQEYFSYISISNPKYLFGFKSRAK